MSRSGEGDDDEQCREGNATATEEVGVDWLVVGSVQNGWLEGEQQQNWSKDSFRSSKPPLTGTHALTDMVSVKRVYN